MVVFLKPPPTSANRLKQPLGVEDWRLIAGDNPYFIDYEDISQVRAGRSDFTVNGYSIPTTLAGNSSLAAERFADLVESISYEMRRR